MTGTEITETDTTTIRIFQADSLSIRRVQLDRREHGNVFCSMQSLLHEAIALLVAQERAK